MAGKWYAFNVDYVGLESDGSDWLVYANEVGPEEVGADTDKRHLEKGLYDLPGPSSAVWYGYASAVNESAACERVVRAYLGEMAHAK